MLSCIRKELKLHLAATWSKISQTSIKVGKTKLLPLVLLLLAQKWAFYWSLIRWAMIQNCWGLLCRDDRRPLLSKWALLHCIKVLFEHFYKHKAPHHKQKHLIYSIISVIVFPPKYNFCLCNITSFIEAFANLPSLLLTNSSFPPLLLSESQGMFNLGQIFQTPKQKF